MEKIIFFIIVMIFISSAYSQDKVTTLKQGEKYNIKVLNSEKRKYKIKLKEGEFCKMKVMQDGVDVVVDVSGPGKSLIQSVDTPNGEHGPEYVQFIAEEKGTYYIDIYPFFEDPEMSAEVKNLILQKNQRSYNIDSISVSVNDPAGIKLYNEILNGRKFIEALNLNLETTTSGKDIPDNWFTNSSKTKISTTEKHGGNNSVLLQRDDTSESFVSFLRNIPSAYRGNEIEVRAYMKMNNVSDGGIGLMLRLDGIDQTLKFENLQEKNIHGTSDWTLYSVKLPYADKTKSISFGSLLMGTGQLWTDDFQILVDGNDISKIKYYEPVIYKADRDREFREGSSINSIDLTERVTDNLMMLGKVWGFLKYYHPAIAKGEYNWDNELFRILPNVIAANNSSDAGDIMAEWIESLGKTDTGKVNLGEDILVRISPDLNWINNPEFGKRLTSQLVRIKDAKREPENYYISKVPGVGNPEFNNERSYQTMKYPDAGYRLLSLFRYWNIIEYYFPSKYLTGENWDEVLKEYIPKFVNAADETNYKLASVSLIARIHDTHAGVNDQALEEYKGKNYAPVEIRFVEDKAVVTDYYDSTLGEKSGLIVGDIIENINGKTIDEVIKERAPYYPSSNVPVQLRDISMNLLRTNDSVLTIGYNRAGKTMNLQMECYSQDRMNVYKKFMKRDTCFKMISSDISYLYPGTIKNAYLPEIMPEVLKSKGLIIDLRCYPSEFIVFTLSQYLQPSAADFVKFSVGSISTPGLFTMTNSVRIGAKNENYYKGKIVIIVNEETQSQAEYTTMALRTAPGAIVIGSTTAGADGNVSEIVLPGGMKTWISGIGVYYPDGKETQRIGIVPDIEVKPTIDGIRSVKDEVLEKAIEIINGN